MTGQDRPIKDIIYMARTIEASGKAGATPSRADAEAVVSSIIGPADREFAGRYGCNYWNYLKALLSDYVAARELGDRFVVKGAPFNWHSSVGLKCGAVILRKDFFRGDRRVEPELYVEAGLLNLQNGTLPGLACGFHYLLSPEGDRSGFVQGVLIDDGLKGMAWKLSNDGFVNPSFAARGALGFWSAEAALYRSWDESSLPTDLRGQVFEAFDELLPLYRGITSLNVQ